MSDVYGTSPIKRHRRTNAEMDVFRGELLDIIESFAPVTVRQAFYQLTTRGVISKTENQYQSVSRELVAMRLDGRVPWDAVADNSRWMRKPDTFDSMQDALSETARFYRRNLWRDTDARVEIWLEKEALAGVAVEITGRYDVPLMVSRGFSSLSFIHESAVAIENAGKPTFIYYFGDRDPSGVCIDQSIEKRLREMTSSPFRFERVAVLPEQIKAWNLPTRPTKKSDGRSKNFEGESVELDAIPPDQLKGLVAECILKHLDVEAYHRMREVENLERETLQELGDYLPGAAA